MADISCHILYVDDDTTLVRLVEKACARRGYSLSHATNVDDALISIDAGHFDVVVLDHNLRAGTGLDLLRQLENHEVKPPVIYVTGSTDAAIAVSALKAGAVDYVAKTAGGDFLELLFSAVEQSLERAQLTAAKLCAEQEVRAARDRAELLLREVNHRVANSLSLVSALVRLQSSALSDPSAVEALAETQARISAIAGVHRRLYKSTDVGRVALGAYVQDLVEELDATMRGNDQQGHIRLVTDEVFVNPDKAVSVGVALTELITNAFKYAYPEGQVGDVRISLTLCPDERVHIAIEDDGVGWSGAGAAKGTGLGMKIVKAMATTLGCDVVYENRQLGTRITLEFQA